VIPLERAREIASDAAKEAVYDNLTALSVDVNNLHKERAAFAPRGPASSMRCDDRTSPRDDLK